MNAAIWLGAAVFATLGAGRAISSDAMQTLLTPRHYPYFSGVIGQLIAASYWHLHITCAVIALLHLAAESLYFGKVVGKKILALLLALFILAIAQVTLIQPALKRLHLASHATNRVLSERQAAVGAYKSWNGASQVLSVFMIFGLSVYLWRIANPPEATRFVRPGKYRG